MYIFKQYATVINKTATGPVAMDKGEAAYPFGNRAHFKFNLAHNNNSYTHTIYTTYYHATRCTSLAKA